VDLDLTTIKYWQRFQSMIAELLARELPHSAEIKPNPGDGGIDVFDGKLTGEFDIYQVKYWTGSIGKSQKTQIRNSLKAAASRSPSQWFLVTATTFDLATQTWFERHTEQYPFPCAHWGAARVRALLNRHFGIKKNYFEDPGGLAMRQVAAAMGGPAQLDGHPRPLLLDRLVEISELYDANNSDWAFEKHIGAGGELTIVPVPRHGSASFTLSVKLRTQGTQAEADRLAAAWNDLSARGIPLRLNGTQVEELVADFGCGYVERSTDCALEIRPIVPDNCIATRFSFAALDGTTTVVPHVSLSLTEAGTEQIRLSNERQSAPMTVSFVLPTNPVMNVPDNVTFSFSRDPVGRHAAELLPYDQLAANLHKGGELTVSILDSGKSLMRIAAKPRPADPRDAEWIDILEMIVAVEDTFAVSLSTPEVVTRDDILSLRKLASILRCGAFRPLDDVLTVERDSEQAESLLGLLPCGPDQALYAELDHLELSVFGTDIDVGPATAILPQAVLLSAEECSPIVEGDPGLTRFGFRAKPGTTVMRASRWPRPAEPR